jgi:hypothetical protein
VFLEIAIHSIVVGDVPYMGITGTTASKVIINAVEHLVTKQELDLFGTEHLDEAGVVIEVAAICGGCGTPLVGID